MFDVVSELALCRDFLDVMMKRFPDMSREEWCEVMGCSRMVFFNLKMGRFERLLDGYITMRILCLLDGRWQLPAVLRAAADVFPDREAFCARFGEFLRERIKDGSLMGCASQLGYSATAVKKWRDGGAVPNVYGICDVCAFFGVEDPRLLWRGCLDGGR